MGRTVALNANAMVRSVVKNFLVLFVMLNLSWELTVMTLIEMPLTAIIQSKHIRLSNVGVTTSECFEKQNVPKKKCTWMCSEGCNDLST